jgi:hypothetical protein
MMSDDKSGRQIMTADEMARDIQYTVDQDGKVTAVVVAPSLWRRLLDELEETEDRTLVRDLRDQLRSHPQTWALTWDEVADEWR